MKNEQSPMHCIGRFAAAVTRHHSRIILPPGAIDASAMCCLPHRKMANLAREIAQMKQQQEFAAFGRAKGDSRVIRFSPAQATSNSSA